MKLKIQLKTLSSGWDFEFKSNEYCIVAIVIRSISHDTQGEAGSTMITDESFLSPIIHAIQNLAENPERSSLVILDGIQTSCQYENEALFYNCSFNIPEKNSRAAEIIRCLLVIISRLRKNIHCLDSFDLFDSWENWNTEFTERARIDTDWNTEFTERARIDTDF